MIIKRFLVTDTIGADMATEFTDNKDKFIEALHAQLPTALEALGLQGEGYAKLLCPVDTGRLRNSITHTRDDSSAYIGTNVEYAAYVELGTSKSRAHPYLQPAVQDHKEEYKAIFQKYLSDN